MTFEHLRTYAIVGGLGVAVYSVVTTGLRTASFFSGITMWDTGRVGFYMGTLCGIGIFSFCNAIWNRYCSLRPETVYWGMLKRVEKDPVVMAQLGTGLTPLSDFRAYTITPGGIRTDPEERAKYTNAVSKWYRPRRMQMMFSIKGSKGKGMISAEVESTSLMSDFRYVHLALDNFENEERTLLAGRDDKSVYTGRIQLR